MKKNAFTLIELIATIGLLGMLATITITVAVRKINETKEKARDTMIESIELAAKQYITDQGNEILEFNNNDNIYITLQTLVEEEYFTESLVDPTTKKSLPLTNEVYVTREESGEIISTYNVNQRKEPKLTLIGSYNEYVEEGKEYVEKGVIAKSITGSDASSSVTIKGTVDTTIPNTYKITYELGNIKITRNVIVYSKNISSEEILKASTYIERLYKTNNYQNDELYNPKFTSEGKEYDTGIRYRGSNPNNYVYFNCDDKDSNNIKYGEKDYDYKDSCEVWRMVGVFDVDNGEGKVEKRLKLINTESAFMSSWDSSVSDINRGWGINQWGESTYEDGTFYEGSDIMRLLNGYYIGKSGTSCTHCNGENQVTCTQMCTKESLKSANMKILTSIANNMISPVIWKTSGMRDIRPKSISELYIDERAMYSGKQCNSSATFEGFLSCNDNVIRRFEWKGLISLIYPSDYAYASSDEFCTITAAFTGSTCGNNNWLNTNTYWILNPYISRDYSFNVCAVFDVGYISSTNAQVVFYIRPSLYLKSSIKIKGGNGSTASPYILAQ